jgi:hypothetical protein
MSGNQVIVEIDGSKMTQEFLEIVQRAYKKKPQKSDLRALEKWLKDTPGLWRAVFDLVNVLQTNFISRLITKEAAQIAIQENISGLRQELGYDNSSALEKLLIENIINTWLRYQWTDYQLMAFMGQDSVRFVELEFWEKRLSMSQRRYLQACETLAKVRRLMSLHPLIQVNIADDNGQQVNIAGDFVKR